MGSVKTATNSSAYHGYEFLALFFMSNLFNAGANGAGAPAGVDVTLDIPIDGGPAVLPDFTGDYSNSSVQVAPDGTPLPFKIRYKGDFANTGAVRGYPAAVLGSRVGGNETWGVISGQTTALPGYPNGVRNNAAGVGGSYPIYDLTACQAATGFPQFTGNLPDSKIVCQWRDTGDAATYNVFSDTYWHNVSDIDLLPTSDAAGTNHIAALQDTINGISGRDTATYNLNFWHYIPSGFNATGGTLVASGLEIEPGKPVSIYLKLETGGVNNFYYIAFVYDTTQTNHVLDYNAYANWMMAGTTGTGTFLTEVYNSTASQTIITQMANPTNGAVPKAVRPPDGNFVCSDLELGCEMWGTNSGGEAEITFDQIGFVVDGTRHGIIYDSTVISGGSTNPVEQSRYELFLCELDHSGGTLRFASTAWLSDEHQPYNDWLVDTPYLEESVVNLINVGDVTAINPDAATDDWLSYDWHGFRCRWYFGDERQRKSEFRTIATATIEGCRFVSSGVYQFDLVSDAKKFDRTFLSAAQSYDDTAVNVLNALFAEANSTPEYEVGTYTVVGTVNLSTELRFDLTENANFDEVLRTICRSLNARRRISQSGSLEIVSRVVKTEPDITLDDDVIDDESVRMIDTIEPVATVSIEYDNGTGIEVVDTEAAINGLTTDRRVVTYLKNQADALALGEIEATRNRQAKRVWEMDILSNAEEFGVAAQPLAVHPDVKGLGEITDMRRKPLEDVTTLEMII